MARHSVILGTVFTAALVLSVTAMPARTTPENQTAWADNSKPEFVQASQVHDLVGASFHAIHSGF